MIMKMNCVSEDAQQSTSNFKAIQNLKDLPNEPPSKPWNWPEISMKTLEIQDVQLTRLLILEKIATKRYKSMAVGLQKNETKNRIIYLRHGMNQETLLLHQKI